MANRGEKNSRPTPKVSGEGSRTSQRVTGFARGGDALVENDIVHGQPDRDTVSRDEPQRKPGDQAQTEDLLKPPALLEEEAASTKSNTRRNS